MIAEFRGKYGFLSNFYPSDVTYDGLVYPTREHAFQAAKAANTADKEKIRNAQTPKEAKALGRKVAMIPTWDETRIEVMRDILRAFFIQHEDLAERLIETHPHELVEGNTWGDRFWGRVNGVGENNLGKALMDVRDELMASL